MPTACYSLESDLLILTCNRLQCLEYSSPDQCPEVIRDAIVARPIFATMAKAPYNRSIYRTIKNTPRPRIGSRKAALAEIGVGGTDSGDVACGVANHVTGEALAVPGQFVNELEAIRLRHVLLDLWP